MPEALKVLFAEPPATRRVGGIETALSGLAQALAATDVAVTRASELTLAQVATADVVHFHGLWETSHHRARGWCERAGKPFLVSPHGMLEDWAFRHRGWKKRPYFYFIERHSIGRARMVLATSEEEAHTLRRWFERVTVLPLGGNPVATPERNVARQRLGLSADEFVILFLSRLHEKKGLHLLVNVMPEVARAAGRPVHLLIVGDGDARYVDPLRRATEAWHTPLRATWAGARWGDEKWDYLVAADLFCLPSFSENFGLAVLESLFAGTPVLTTFATPWPSLRETLPIHFVNPREPDLAAALRAQVAAPVAPAAERSAARAEAIARFNWSALAPRYAALYRQITAPSL